MFAGCKDADSLGAKNLNAFSDNITIVTVDVTQQQSIDSAHELIAQTLRK